MGRHLSVATIIEKNKIASTVAFLPALQIHVRNPGTGSLVETLYVVDNTENLTYQGNVYTAMAFDLDIKVEAGEKPEMQLGMKDYTRAIQGRMDLYGGGIGFDVTFLIINSGNLEQPPELMENFTVTGANVKDYNVTFRLGAENPLTRRFPARFQFKDRCPWRYKGAECKYAGPLATCDYTLQGENGCAAHNNSENFGGFPGIKPVSQ
jgi:hypothetical protein